MKKEKSFFLRYSRLFFLIFGVVSIAAIYYQLDSIDTSEFKIKSFSTKFFLIGIALQSLFWLSLTISWRNISKIVLKTTPSYINSFCEISLVSLGKYLPGKFWGMLARGIQIKKTGNSTGSILHATILEQVIFLHAGVTMSFLAAIIFLPDTQKLIALTVSIVFFFIGLHYRNIFIKVTSQLIRKFKKEAIASEVITISVSQYLTAFLLYSFVWLFSGAVFSSLFFIFSTRPPDIELVSVLVFSNIVSITIGFLVIIAPGGIGVREAMIALTLTPYLSINEAVFLALVYRIWVVVADALSGVFSITKLYFFDVHHETRSSTRS